MPGCAGRLHRGAPLSDGGVVIRPTTHVEVQVAHAARTSFARLVSLLTAYSGGDIMAAEDAVSDAFHEALHVWPTSGIPENPDAWLLTVARNRERDRFKSSSFRLAAELGPAEEQRGLTDDVDLDRIPDQRLRLLFVCAHPSIDPSIRTPLMLQTVLGQEAQDIARAYAVAPAAMAQRLVRAKRKIRDARIPFVIPEKADIPERLEAVLEAIYGVYSLGWDSEPEREIVDDFALEADYLARELTVLLPHEAEVFGLAALMTLSLSRKDARRTASGEFIPLDSQDTALWDRARIAEGEALLLHAHSLGSIGRFQLEAAVQAVHCARAESGVTDWHSLCLLYSAIVAMWPTLGSSVSFAAVIGRAEGPEAGLAALDRLQADDVAEFQPAWAARAYLLAAAGRAAEAERAYTRAIELATEPSVRRYLRACRSTVRPN